MTKPKLKPCPKCGNEVQFKHLHDAPYGLAQAHLDGSERFVCPECGHRLSRAEAEASGCKYVLDVETKGGAK